MERLVTVGIGVLGLLIALRPPQSILAFVSRTSFNGFAVLAPAVLGGLYWKRANRWGAAASIVVGELLVAAAALGLLPVRGTLPVVPILAAAALVFVAVSLLTRAPAGGTELVFPVNARGLAGGSPSWSCSPWPAISGPGDAAPAWSPGCRSGSGTSPCWAWPCR